MHKLQLLEQIPSVSMPVLWQVDLNGSTVQCFLCYVTVCHFLTKYVERQWILYFFVWVTLIKIVNTPPTIDQNDVR